MAARTDEPENSQGGLPGVEPLRLRGPGRPPGAEGRNKRQLREYLASIGISDPAIVLGKTMSMTDEQLQRTVNRKSDGTLVPDAERISLAEAHAMRLKAAAELMPYVHGKMPTIELQPDEALPLLIIEAGSNQLDIDRGRIDGGQRVGALSVGLPLLENQGVAAGEGDASHGATVSRQGESEQGQGFAEDDGDD